MSVRVVAIVPARMAARRLPGKPLLDIGGRPMVVRVVERAARARRVDRVVVATPDAAILDAVRSFGFEAVPTRADHPSGSDRVAEAAGILGLPDEAVVLNVQGDEPLLDPATVDAVAGAFFADPAVRVATAAAPLDPAEAADPARVKVVVDARGDALYFSRAPIPAGGPHRLHVGVYGFRLAALRRFTALPRGRLERAERLEQLRLLEHGVPIRVVRVDAPGRSVDTPGDLERVRARFTSRSDPA